MGDVMRQNPDLMSQFAKAAASSWVVKTPVLEILWVMYSVED